MKTKYYCWREIETDKTGSGYVAQYLDSNGKITEDSKMRAYYATEELCCLACAQYHQWGDVEFAPQSCLE